MFPKDFVKSHVKTPDKFLTEICKDGDELQIVDQQEGKRTYRFILNKTQKILYLTSETETKELTKQAIEYLNEVTGKKYRPANEAKRLIAALSKKDYTLEDIKKVVDNKARAWLGGSMEPYLRPSTLFGPKFDEYLNEGDDKHQQALDELKKIKNSMEGKNAEEKFKF